MKKLFISLLATLSVFFIIVFGLSFLSKGTKQDDWAVAMITDFADVNDQSFNQATYQSGRRWCEEHGIPFTYYKPTDNTDFERRKSLELAIDRGYNVLLCPGYSFAKQIRDLAPKYNDVKFIGIDIVEADFLYDNETTYTLPSNVTCVRFAEELSGYMAGYAAVKEGFTQLGFLGGMAADAVIRFGNGFIYGADAAAKELEIGVTISHVYGGQFFGDNEITKYIDNWYKEGIKVVFSCGGSIYTSAALAAKDNNGYVIGVDSDQSQVINSQYGDGRCITSATKGVERTIEYKLEDLIVNEVWESKFEKLGLVSGENPEENFVGLPMETWSMKNFTISDYKKLVKELYLGERVVPDSLDKPVTTNAVVSYKGNIK